MSTFFRVCFFGFFSGSIYCLLSSTLQFWMGDLGFSEMVIGAFGGMLWPYSLKPLIAPYVEKARFLSYRGMPPKKILGLLSQIWIGAGMLGLACLPLKTCMGLGAFLVLLIACGASVQDLVLETYRIDMTQEAFKGKMAFWAGMGFRGGLFFSGYGGVFFLRRLGLDWPHILGLVGCGGALLNGILLWYAPAPAAWILEKNKDQEGPRGWGFLKEFYRKVWSELAKAHRVALMGFIIVGHKTGDMMMRSMANPFFKGRGFSQEAMASLDKGVFGLGSVLVGSMWARYWVRGRDILDCFGAWALVHGASLWGFLSYLDPSSPLSWGWILLWNLAAGFGGTVYMVYLTGLCFPPHTTSQYSLLISFGSLFSVLARSGGGVLKKALGSWSSFLVFLIVWHALFFLVLLWLRQQGGKGPGQSRVFKR